MGQTRSCQAATIDAQVGLRLRQLRQERGLSLAGVAQMMGHTSGQAVSKYEQGAAFPTALMFKTATALGVPIATFFEGLQLGPQSGVAVPIDPFMAGTLDDSSEARKIAGLLRGAPRPLHPMILRVVKAIVA